MRHVLRYPAGVTVLAAMCYVTLHGQALDARQVLTDARAALGGEKKLSAVKSFIATGRTRQLRGNNLVPIVFEIACELPDKFVRTDEFPAQDSDPTTLGFNGDTLIQFPAPPSGASRAGSPRAPLAGPAGNAGPGGAPSPARGGRGGPPALSPEQRIANVKQDFVRLTLGMFATSFPSYPLTFRYAAQGEAPDGKADILDVAGPANFSARFVIQRDTHLPVILMWQVPAALAQAPPIDYRVYYGDFRDVDGVKWPFRIRRAVGGDTIEETTFDRIKINTKIDPRKFEVPK